MLPPARKLATVISLVAATACLTVLASAATPTTVNLGTAGDFAVLAGAGVTIAAPINSTIIVGDIGSFATTSITGQENLVLVGTNHAGDTTTQTAKSDLMLAYLDATSRTADVIYTDGYNPTGTLQSGVYSSPGSFYVNGLLTLDGQGNSDSVWIFQMGSTLNVASSAQIILINGALASQIFWQVGSSATLETGAQLSGTILASESITLKTGATLNGGALASNGSVTLDQNFISVVPEPSSALILAGSFCGLLGFTRRRSA
jgi:Ice-binding-like/PEP-CTERM motif